jgi:hypothetical protein
LADYRALPPTSQRINKREKPITAPATPASHGKEQSRKFLVAKMRSFKGAQRLN